MLQSFDVKSARAAGYSDDEILGHLTSTRKFDIDGAVKAGYSKPEIIDHLSGLENNATIRQSQEKFTVPQSTMGSMAREFTLGGLESLGVDLESPILGTARNIKNSLMDVGRRNFPTPKQFLAHPEQRGLNTEALKGLAASPVETYRGIKEGDLDKIAHGAGGTIGSIGPFLLGDPEARATAGTAIEKVGGLPIKAADAAVAKVVERTAPLEPGKKMVKAIKPRAGNLGFEMGLDRSMPELKAVEASTGKPITNIDELIEGTKTAKQNVWKQYEQIAGPQAQRGLNASPVADAIQKSIPLKTRVQNPAAAQSIIDRANTYRTNFKMADLEEMLHQTNAELDAYHDKYPSAQRTAAARNPETAHLVAEGAALRELIYNAMDPAGGVAPRELKQRYGSLMNLEEEAYRRRNVAARQQPESLTEQMGRLHAGMKLGGAALKAFRDPGGALVDVGQALAGSKVARAIKEANSTDALIKSAMERYQGMPTPVPYKHVRPAALLSERAGSPFAMGDIASDIKTPSLVDELPQTWEQMYPPGRLQLPAASTDVPIIRTIQRSSGRTFEMPSAPPTGLLTSGRLQLPERAGSPFVTPPPRLSLREELRIRAGKPNLKQELHKK